MVIKFEDLEDEINYYVIYEKRFIFNDLYSGFIIRHFFNDNDIIFKYTPNCTIRDLWRL